MEEVDLSGIAATLVVTVHELEDAMVTGTADDAAQMLGTTTEAMAKKLGVSVSDNQVIMSAQSASPPTPSAS